MPLNLKILMISFCKSDKRTHYAMLSLRKANQTGLWQRKINIPSCENENISVRPRLPAMLGMNLRHGV